ILRPISSAVICSRTRAFSSFPPSMARTPGIFAASVLTVMDASASSLQTMTSQSTGASPFSTSADVLWNAATTDTPAGTSSAVCCAAEPSQRPRVRVARPPTLAARGTVVSTTMLPSGIASLICLSRALWPSNGMVSTTRSAAAQAALFSSPEIVAWLPTAARIFAAASRARAASRDPMITLSPARAQRRASPKPSAPVPPRTAMTPGMITGTPSGKLRFQCFLDRHLVRPQSEADFRIDGIAFGGNAAGLKNQRLEFLAAGVLSRRGAGLARDVLLHQCSTVVIGARMQAELRQATVQLYPRHLNIVDGAGQHHPGQGVNFEMLGQSGAGPRDSLMIEQCVLMHEAERNKLGEASGLLLNVPE